MYCILHRVFFDYPDPCPACRDELDHLAAPQVRTREALPLPEEIPVTPRRPNQYIYCVLCGTPLTADDAADTTCAACEAREDARYDAALERDREVLLRYLDHNSASW